MSNNLIKYAFTGGEVSPTLYGRSDLEQYDLGVALAENWFVDYKGGLNSRQGQEFCEFIYRDDLETKFAQFKFAPNIANTYGLIFGHNYVRFFQDGSYVLEDPKTITAISPSGVVSSTGHGFSVGDWVKLSQVVGPGNVNDRTFQISAVTTNTFTVKIVPDLSSLVPTPAYVSGGTASRIYTVSTPYASTDLVNIRIYQRRDLLRITSFDFPIYNLSRAGNTNWILTQEVIGNTQNGPTGLLPVASASGSAGVLFTVTAVFADGSETIMANPYPLTGIINYSVTAGFVTVNWNVQAEAVYYNVYRSIIVSDGTKLTKGLQLGFVGKVYGTQFIDSNIIPDFTKSPPTNFNPFAPGAIENVFVTNSGTGYDQLTAAMSIAGGGGSGFVGFPIVDSGGHIVGVKVLFAGTGYVSPVVTFTGGTGAAATASAREITGTYPALSTLFQSRQLYAASTADPLTLWASQPRRYSDFDFSEVTIDSDSYQFDVDSAEVSPLKHLLAMRGGLVMMSQTEIWQLTGGADGVVTPTNALADPQTYTGVSDVVPIKVGTDLLYIEGKGYAVRLLNYNDYSKVYSGEDKSIVSSHLFSKTKQITSWAFAENPFKVVLGVRSDGALVAFTLVKDEKVFAWTHFLTKGKYKDVIAIEEAGVDRAYFITQRLINGRLTKFLERQAERNFTVVEDAYCVDAGLTLDATYPAADLNASSYTGIITFTASASVFSAGDVGKILRMGGGKIKVTSYVSGTQVVGTSQRDITDLMFQDPLNRVNTQSAGTWTLDLPVKIVSGLWHLEGEPVAVLADGNVVNGKTVTEGQITLDNAATRITVGVPFTCTCQTLPPVVSDTPIEGRRKRIVGVATRVNDTRGLSTGRALDSLYDARERTNENYGEPIALFSGVNIQLIDPEWDENGQTYFVQDNPLPATLLGIVFDVEVGDDTD